MPKEITTEELKGILPRTTSITTKRSGNDVKYKFRTKKTLFTLKVPMDENSSVETIISSNSSLKIDEL